MQRWFPSAVDREITIFTFDFIHAITFSLSLGKHVHEMYTPYTQLGLLGLYLILVQNIPCVYTLQPPRRGGSIVYTQSMF